MDSETKGYDIIGDVHGHAVELKALLFDMGYRRHGRVCRHADRKAVFVGDFVDRGPAIGEVIEIARAMVDAGDALAVMGNHEYNAIAFHTAVPDRSGRHFRGHSSKNCEQHQQTLYQLSCGELNDAIAWFKALPVAVDVGGIRVAHASWQTRDIECINQALNTAGRFTPEFLATAENPGTGLHTAIENVLKGPELRLPSGHFILDKAKKSESPFGLSGTRTVSGVPIASTTLAAMKCPTFRSTLAIWRWSKLTHLTPCRCLWATVG